jgi:hypothetical protein
VESNTPYSCTTAYYLLAGHLNFEGKTFSPQDSVKLFSFCMEKKHLTYNFPELILGQKQNQKNPHC